LEIPGNQEFGQAKFQRLIKYLERFQMKLDFREEVISRDYSLLGAIGT
jgi:hypothetical protein